MQIKSGFVMVSLVVILWLVLAPPAVLQSTLQRVTADSTTQSSALQSSNADSSGNALPAHSKTQADPFSYIMLEIVLIVFVAAVGRKLAFRFNQPAVLGELLLGVILGNVAYWSHSELFFLTMHLDSTMEIITNIWSQNVSVVQAIQAAFSAEELLPGEIGAQMLNIITGPTSKTLIPMVFALWLFSNFGVILLLFMVGLETSLDEILVVGFRATLVAFVGVIVPFVLGFLVTLWLIPKAPMTVHIFIPSILCATSVGITARVLSDLKKLQTPEAQIILGAAVIDDILGLIVLAVVVGIVTTGHVVFGKIMIALMASVLFLIGVFALARLLPRWKKYLFRDQNDPNEKLLFPLSFALLMAWLVSSIGLAAILGAFAAGLLINEDLYTNHTTKMPTVRQMVAPLETLFTPVFFVMMGMQVNLEAFFQPEILRLALAITAVAVIGKIVAGLVTDRQQTDWLSVGIGMIPRGEVGLIAVSVGKTFGVVNDAIYSAIVLMVISTTFIVPSSLKWSMNRKAKS